MADHELLAEIKNLLEAERQQTRKIVREELATNNTILGTIVRVEIAAAKEDLTKKIERKRTNHETRIKQLEDPEAFPRSH